VPRFAIGLETNVLNIAGRRITAISRGPWETRPGPEMPGIATSEWRYCDIRVVLDDGSVLVLVPGDVHIEACSPASRGELDTHDCITEAVGATVVDVLEDEGPAVFVVLDGGRYLESALVPGGTAVTLGRFDSWPKGRSACGRSLISGEKRAYRHLAAP
jgi:hypothetical protein